MINDQLEPELWLDQDNNDLAKVVDILHTLELHTQDFHAKAGFRTVSLALDSLIRRNMERKKAWTANGKKVRTN